LAAKKATRTTTKKLKDKWRAKQWYTIHAPDIFDNREVPATPADDPSKLNNRIVEVTMQELTQDFGKSHIKLKFKIIRIAGFEAYTDFVGHEFTTDYIRRLTRRRRTKIDGVFDVTTKDGYRIRVKPMAIAEHRIQSSQKSAIRHLMKDVVLDAANKRRMGEFVHDMITGDISRGIFRNCKHIYRLKRIDIRRSEILGQLSSHKPVEGEPEDVDAIPEPAEEGEATSGSDITEEGEEVTGDEGEIPLEEGTSGTEMDIETDEAIAEEDDEKQMIVEEIMDEVPTDVVGAEEEAGNKEESEEITDVVPTDEVVAAEEVADNIVGSEESMEGEEPEIKDVETTPPEAAFEESPEKTGDHAPEADAVVPADKSEKKVAEPEVPEPEVSDSEQQESGSEQKEEEE